jgi:hypothetical protein
MEEAARRNAAHPRFSVQQKGLEALHLKDAPLPKGPQRVDLKQRKLVPAT